MAVDSSRFPKYRKHTSRDKAFIAFDRKRIYLRGAYDSAESREHYAELLAQIVTGGSPAADPAPEATATAIGQAPLGRIAALWLEHLKQTGLAAIIDRLQGFATDLAVIKDGMEERSVETLGIPNAVDMRKSLDKLESFCGVAKKAFTDYRMNPPKE